jgi:hypothetical protein
MQRMNILDEPEIDCHNHVFDPARFPCAADTFFRPSGQEIGTAAPLLHVLDAYRVRHALVVGPNSGYGSDTRCLSTPLHEAAGGLKESPSCRMT